MANITEPTEEKLKEIQEWLKDRPQIIKDLCEKIPPYKLYEVKTGNCDKCLTKKVTIYSYQEDGTITVNLSRNFNIIKEDLNVFGMFPEELIECDLPTDNELKLINYSNSLFSEITENTGINAAFNKIMRSYAETLNEEQINLLVDKLMILGYGQTEARAYFEEIKK